MPTSFRLIVTRNVQKWECYQCRPAGRMYFQLLACSNSGIAPKNFIKPIASIPEQKCSTQYNFY